MKNLRPVSMNRLIVTTAFLLLCGQALAQSASFQALRKNFGGDPGVESFKVGGIICRAVFWVAGDEEWKEAVRDVSSVSFIRIPKPNFASHKLSVGGFRKYLAKDRYESLATVREHGETVEVYLQESGKKNDRYLVLVENPDEVVVVELIGYIDIQKLKDLEGKESI